MPSTRNLAFVGCRLLSLYVLYQGMLKLGFVVIFLAQLIETNRPISLVQSSVIIFVIEIMIFLLFWTGADRISRWAVNHEQDVDDLAEVSRSDILSVAVVISGIFILVFTTPQIVSLIISYPFQGNQNLTFLISPVMSFVMGIVCLAGRKTLVDLVVRARRW